MDGVGLADSRARLAQAFGARASLRLANAPGGGGVATLEWPLVAADADGAVAGGLAGVVAAPAPDRRDADVVYFEADARYTRVVYVADGAEGEALIRTPLKELLARLDEQAFMQVHRSVIVARRWIAAAVRVDEGQMHLTLRGRPERLPVSRPFQGLFKGQ